MAGYDKGKAAEIVGVSRDELKRRAKAAGYDNTEDYFNSIGGVAYPIVEAIKKEIIALDEQLDGLGSIGLTDEEKETFLQKAISQVQPYYDRKAAEIEAQIKEGKVRTAEETLLTIREVETETAKLLEQYDLSTSATEEEFANRLGALTASTDDQIEAKTTEWRQRMENVKLSQIQSGIFSSGIGKKKREELASQEAQEIGSIEEREAEAKTGLETERKYDLENIRLAREAAQQRRIQSIGTPDETAQQEQAAREQLGLSPTEQIGSETEIAQARVARGITPRLDSATALTNLDEERLKATESRKYELQADELAMREQSYESQRQKILAERAKKASQLQRYGIYA